MLVALFILIIFLIVLCYISKHFALLVVTGNSMYPTYKDGDVVLLHKTDKFDIGDVVVVTDPSISNHTIIKRLLAKTYIKSEYRYWIEGDNKEVSKDSRYFGHIKKDAIEGKIITWKKKKH